MRTSHPSEAAQRERRPAPADDVWRQIEELVEEVAQLAQSEVAEQDFYSAILDRVVRAGACLAGAVWRVDGQAQPTIVSQNNWDATGLHSAAEDRSKHGQAIAAVCRKPGVVSLAPQSGSGGRIHNATSMHVLAHSVFLDGDAIRTVELFLASDLSPDTHAGIGEVLQAMCELASDYHRDLRYRELGNQQEIWQRVERYAECVHAGIELDPTVYAIVNEGRRLAQCDRTTLVVRRGNRWEAMAISGIDSVDRRAEAVRHLEHLARQVAAIEESVWYEGNLDELPPQIIEPIETCVDESNAKQLVAIPLCPALSPEADKRSDRPFGVLILEGFTPNESRESYAPRVEAVTRHGGSALANALEVDRLPFRRLLKTLAWASTSSRLVKFAAAAVAVAIVTAAALLIQVPFSIECKGELQPAVRRRVFAPFDGRVTELKVSHGDQVAAGQELALIASDSLILEHTQVLGQIETTAEQLNAIEAARLDANPTTADQRDEFARLAADEQRLQKDLDNLREQQTLLKQQIERQTIRSPIAGRVLTWEVAEQLTGRPVQRGQALMTVADTDGAWVAEVQVQDRDVSCVRAIEQEHQTAPEVSFVLATHSETTYDGQVERMSMVSEPDAERGLCATAIVKFDEQQVPNLRPGGGVRAEIHCGKRSLGYVWLRDFIDALRRWFFI